jgi:succinyl-diaminopimelate desuccinylase
VLGPAIEKVYGVHPAPRGKGGVTVAGALRSRGFPAAVWMTTTGEAHRANESCSIKHMIGDARVFAEVFRTRLPGG